MQVYTKTGLLLLAFLFALTSAVYGGAVDKDKDKEKKTRNGTAASKTQAGECPSEGNAAAELDVNNVRARLYNNGNLFFAADHVYEVPKGSNHHSVFASGIWIGGMAGNELRMAAATYSDYEFRPGPLFDDGTAPSNCQAYDRLWKVSVTDLERFDATGEATSDLRDWPTGLGAPTLDANGNRVVPTSLDQKIDLAAGQRPEILGDQTIWWIMNDVAAPHNTTETPPIGIEAQVTAFAFNQAGALGNTTFYKYRLAYKGDVPLTDVYLGVWSDPDLGGAGDDYVGADTTLGLGIVYNALPTDSDYGNRPPALGYDFFQGPLVEAPGQTWTDPDGTVHENATRLGMQKFVFYNNDATPQGNPNNAEEYYGYLRGVWRDGVPITFGGTGRGFSNVPANYMYPANPPNFWSEFNIDGRGTAIAPGDRRFIQSVGPFNMNPGDVQEIVFGIVWAQDTEAASNPHLASLAKLKRDDALAQQVFDINFQLPPPPDPPRVKVTELNEEVILTWDYPPASNNFLGRYEAVNPLISDVPDLTYNFEGYIVYRFDSPSDTEGEVIAVYDIPNGITRILRQTPEGLVNVDVQGTDSGLQHSIRITGLTNYTEYHYGVQAYAYNEFSSPRTYRSAIRRVTAVPSRPGPREGGTVVVEDAFGAEPDTIIAQQVGQGSVRVRVVDPAQVTGQQYRLEFVNVTKEDAEGHRQNFIAYDVYRGNERVLSGADYVDRTCTRSGAFRLEDCQAPPQTENAFVIDGLSFSIAGAPPGFQDFQIVANAGGPLDPIDTAAPCVIGFPCAVSGDITGGLPTNSQQVGPARWFFHTGGDNRSSFESFVARVTRDGGNFGVMGAFDYEQRWTGTSIAAKNGIFGQSGPDVEVPFELWNTGIGTPNDPSDDYRMIPIILDEGLPGVYDMKVIGPNGEGDHAVSGGANDPYTDWIYWYNPVDTSPGEAGYNAYFNGGNLDLGQIADEVFARTVWVNWNGGATPPYNQDLPEQGTVLRIVTSKPNQPGDRFTFETAPFAPQRGATEVAEASLDDIGVVPNPYKGASAYEVSRITDEVRIINLPQSATIRIFTLNGTLIRTIEKNSPSTFIAWDLKTDNGLPIASGMYLIHVETELGDRVIKFGAVKKTVQLNEL